MQSIDAKDFFNIPSPSAPMISIQFRTIVKQNAAIDDQSQWESITFDPSNLFNNITIEDESGFQKIELTLIDKDFSHLETVLTKAMIAPRLANKIVSSDIVTSKDTKYFQFKVDNSSMINMRIRFGYSNIVENSINETNFGSVYYNRITNNKTVIKTPWIYLQILNIVFNITDAGLQATVSAFSTADTFLSRAKILRRFMIFKGKPKDMIKTIKNLLEDVSNKDISIEIQDQPEDIKTKDNKNYIEIALGNTNDEDANSWMSLKNFLDIFCSKVPPKIYDLKSVEVVGTEETKLKKTHKIIRYSYMLKQEITSAKKLKYTLIFYYPDPLSTAKKQNKIRSYIWKNYGQSIVMNLNISSKVDFASLNRQIFVYDKTSQEMSLNIARSPKVNIDNKDNVVDNSLGRVDDVTKAFNDDFDISFVSDTVSVSGADRTSIGARISEQVVHYLNQSIFEGSIEIPGDPFYLFDAYLQPFSFMIKVIILRPDYLKKEQSAYERKAGGISYLSGFYAVSKITHNINESGFTTTLDITRWPED